MPGWVRCVRRYRTARPESCRRPGGRSRSARREPGPSSLRRCQGRSVRIVSSMLMNSKVTRREPSNLLSVEKVGISGLGSYGLVRSPSCHRRCHRRRSGRKGGSRAGRRPEPWSPTAPRSSPRHSISSGRTVPTSRWTRSRMLRASASRSSTATSATRTPSCVALSEIFVERLNEAVDRAVAITPRGRESFANALRATLELIAEERNLFFFVDRGRPWHRHDTAARRTVVGLDDRPVQRDAHRTRPRPGTGAHLGVRHGRRDPDRRDDVAPRRRSHLRRGDRGPHAAHVAGDHRGRTASARLGLSHGPRSRPPPSAPHSARDRTPRAAVGARLARQPEHPLTEDVALHLVGAAGDAIPRRAEEMLVPRVGAPLAGVGDQSRPEDVTDHVADLGHALGPQQLAERTFRPRRARAGEIGGAAVRVRLDPAVDEDAGELVAQHRVVGEVPPCARWRAAA